MKRDKSKLPTIAPKLVVDYNPEKSELRFKNLNFNIMGYIFSGINFLKLAQGARDTNASKRQNKENL